MSRRRQSKQLPARIPLQESLTLFEKGELPIDETITLTTADDFIKDVFSLPKDRDTEITFNQTHLRYCLYKGSYYTKNIRQTKGNKTDDQLRHNELNHLVGIEFFNEEKLNELISSPVAIIPARANDEPTLNRYFIVLNAKHNGSNICLIAEPYGQGTRNGISYPSMHITSIYSKENINSIIELEAKREAIAELILGHAIETGIKIPDELQNRPFYLNKEKAHLIDEYKTSLNILIDKNPTAKNAFDKYSKNVGEEIKKATKTANHEMQSSCPTALSSYADNLLLLTKDVKREKINFDKFDKDLKNNREDLFTHINQMLENDNTSDEILDRYTLTDYIASKLNVVGIKTYVIDDETIKNYAIIKNNSLNNSDYIPFNTLSQKEFYGFALGNQIYLKEDGIRADVLLHEYAHLFLNVFAKLHADEWKTIKASLKNDPDIIREINGPEYREKLGSKSEDISLTEYLCDKMAGHGVEALKNANIEDVINMATLSAIDVISPTLLSSERIKNLSTLMMSDLISGQFKKDALDLNTMNFKERGLFDDMEDDESNNTENDTDDSIEDHIKTEYVFEPKHDEKLENEIRQRLNLSDNVAVKVLDYTTVEADKVYLASKKTILDRPYPDYLPPLYGSQINPKKNFDIPAIPYENNIILWGKSDLTENITFYKLSPEVYTALCDYNITYFRALDERRIKDNQKVLDEIIDELNSKHSGDFIIKKETEKNTTLTIYQKKRALNFKYEMLNPNADKPDRFAPHKYIKSFSLDPNKTLKDKDAVIIKYDNISNFSYTNHSDNIVGFLSENEFLFPKVYRQKRTPFVRKMYTTTYNRIKDLLVIFDNTDEINIEKVFTAWKSVRAILYQNRIDVSEQENNLLSSFQKGRETSYGNSNTKDTLLDKYGVLIKRQNGDEINEKETEELKNTLNYAYSVFGDLSAITKKHGIKVSHAGSVNMHASKAIGLWFPYYKAIGISFKHEEEALSTTIHEFAHFVDYVRGQKTHHWHSSHIPGSDEYRIANTFRSITMPKGNYLCSSHECFARCMQLYADVKEFYNKHNEYSEENQAKEGMTHEEWRVQHEKITDLFKKEYPRYNAAFDSTGNIEIMLPAYHFTNEGDTKDYDNKDYDNYKLTKSYGKSLYSMCDEYIATIKEEFSIKEFKAETSTPSLLTLTNDEIHTLSECIKNKSDFVINNPALDKPIHLVWGTMGDISQTKHGIAGYGLEHFIQRRYESDKKNADELTASILLIADAMKRATPTMHEESATKRNLIANGIKTIIDSVDKTKESNTELNHWKYISSMASEKYEAIKKEGKVAIQTVIAQYGFTQDFSEIRNQVVALITSIDRIREEHPIVNDLHEKKSKKIIFLMGDVLNNPQKQLFDKTEQEYKENGVKVINALTIVNNIPGLAEIKKTKTRIGNIIPALRKALKNNDKISEIVFIPHEGEENKIEIDIKEYAAKHGVETTKFEVLENTQETKKEETNNMNEQKEPHKEEFLTSAEAIKRYGYKFNKKQMLGLKDQLFFAFLIDNKNEHYSGDKNISKALYTRLSRNMANIVLVSAKERLSLEKTLARVHGKVDLDNYRIYGWETKGKIFIAEDAISGNALLHEYTHLWSKAVQSSNPLLWEKIKQNVMQTNLFREMYNDERYKDIKHDIDNLCGETLSRLSGADNIARLEERRNSLMVNEYQQSDESTEEALSSLYGWLEEDVFNGYAHTLNLKEITTRILGDALEGKQTEQIQSSYKNQMTYTPNATFNKERALREGYTKLSPILLEQYFSVRSTITPRMKEHYIKHFKSLTKADPQKACEVLQDMVREEALSAHFFNKIRDENYPDKAFRKHFINAYNANAEEKFISLFKNGDSFRVINGVADNDVSSHYTNFKNFVLRDYLKNDNEIAKIVISSFIKSEKGDAVKLLYDACGENMDYRRKIRALLPEIEVEDTTHKTRHKVADTFGVINYDTNELLSSAYNTTYIDVNNIRGITSDLTLEERALVLSDDFKRNFGSIHRRDDEEIKALKQSGQYNKEEIKAMEWKEKHYFSDKNEIKPYVIKAIGNGYTLNSLYTNEQVKTAMEKLSAENKETFNKITKEEEVKNAFETTDKMTELKTEQEREQTAEKITAPKPEAQDNRYSIRHASRATVQINPLDKIRSVFNKNGINPPSLLVDGTIHRFDINKKGDKRGWYVLNSDYVNGKSIVYGAGGDWAGDSTVKVVASDGYMSATDNEAFKKRAEEEQRKKEEEREKEKLLARENASRYYSLSKNTSFPDEIPYLTEHGLTIEDALKNGVHYNSYFNAMQVPLYSNTTGELTTLQTISSSRNEESGAYTKMFLKGSDPNVHAIIGVPTSPLVFVCEGWATGVAIQKAVNDRVYAAMCCHNLQNTVEYIRKEHPDKFIVCIADNDSKKETPDIKGKGQIKAEESGADLVITIPNPKEDAADYALKADLRDFIRSSLTHSKEYREFLNNLEEQNEQKLQQKNEVKTMTL